MWLERNCPSHRIKLSILDHNAFRLRTLVELLINIYYLMLVSFGDLVKRPIEFPLEKHIFLNYVSQDYLCHNTGHTESKTATATASSC